MKQPNVLDCWGTEVLQAAAAVDAPVEAPLHAIAAWLAVLPWLADSRWRKLRTSAPTEVPFSRLLLIFELLGLCISVTCTQQIQHRKLRGLAQVLEALLDALGRRFLLLQLSGGAQQEAAHEPAHGRTTFQMLQWFNQFCRCFAVITIFTHCYAFARKAIFSRWCCIQAGTVTRVTGESERVSLADRR